jgi:Bacteriocin-protection, YdeI or OmpD-Associated/Domain of unknown function (DUF1905)
MRKYSFTAKIEPGPGGGAFVTFPYNVEEEFGTRGSVLVQATFDGIPYAGSLMRCGGPEHMIGILKAIREQLGKNPGDTIKAQLWKDGAERAVEIPADFSALLKKEKLLPVFEKLSYTHRKEYVRWITEAKREETRAARLTKSIAMLRKGVKTPG